MVVEVGVVGAWASFDRIHRLVHSLETEAYRSWEAGLSVEGLEQEVQLVALLLVGSPLVVDPFQDSIVEEVDLHIHLAQP